MKSFKYLKLNIVSLFIFTFLFFNLINFASAATLIFSPQSGTYTKGSSITVNVLVSSSDKTINAASGVISFPIDLLSVSSISKNGSIIGFWAQEPSFLNTNGTVTFEGVILPPWYKGISGKILTIIFKTKESGTANLSFNSGSILAADGMGTDVMLGTGGATFEISGNNQEHPVIVTPTNAEVPKAPQINSSTHPDSSKWYALKDAKFSWGIPKDVIASSILIGRNAKSSPTVLYDPPIGSKEVKDLQDGIWYFHVQLKNDNGWSGVSDFKLQIDTEKPTSFAITEIKKTDATNPKAKFTFVATDKTSGIDYYEIQIDSGLIETWKDDGSHIYITPAEEGGTHTMQVKAVDRAGNYLIHTAEFTIQALEAPKITGYPAEMQSGDMLTVKGITKYPYYQAILSLQDEKGTIKTYLSKADKDGIFIIVSNDELSGGRYTAWVQVKDDRGAISTPSEQVTILVKQSTLIKIGTWTISLMAVLIPLVAFILLLIFLLWHGWHKFFVVGKKLKKEVNEAEDAVHKSFDLLKESIQEKINKLEKIKSKRQLTAKEERINEQLKKDLEDAEKYIDKEVKDIDDLIK